MMFNRSASTSNSVIWSMPISDCASTSPWMSSGVRTPPAPITTTLCMLQPLELAFYVGGPWKSSDAAVCERGECPADVALQKAVLGALSGQPSFEKPGVETVARACRINRLHIRRPRKYSRASGRKRRTLAAQLQCHAGHARGFELFKNRGRGLLSSELLRFR